MMSGGEVVAVVGVLCGVLVMLAAVAVSFAQGSRKNPLPAYLLPDEWKVEKAERVGDYIAWRAVDDELPDCDESVLLACSDAGDLMVIQGYRDDSEQEETGTQWRDVTAWPVRGVTHWAPLPDHPLGPVTAARQA